MKLSKLASLAIVAAVGLSLTSCVSTKKIKYFQGAEYSFIQPQEIQQQTADQ